MKMTRSILKFLRQVADEPMKHVEDLVEPTTGKELGIDENDLWIVSTAVEYNLVFITQDQKGSMRRIIEAAGYASRTLY